MEYGRNCLQISRLVSKLVKKLKAFQKSFEITQTIHTLLKIAYYDLKLK